MIRKYLDEILTICCDEFEVSIEDVKSKMRKEELCFARKAFSLVVKEILDLKNEITATAIKKHNRDVSRYLATQPENRYYKMILKRIKTRINEGNLCIN